MAWRPTWNEPTHGGEGGSPFGAVFGGGRRPFSAVTLLVIANVIVWLLDTLTGRTILTELGALSVRTTVFQLQVWRLVTYQFLHGGLLHIALNMLILWMLGRYIERALGRTAFYVLYFGSGIVGGLFQIAFNWAMVGWYGPVMLEQAAVGASGAVMGVLMAFATLYPRQRLYIFIFFIPVAVEARWLALAYFVMELLYTLQGISAGLMRDNVAHAAHLGGLVVGFLWVKFGHQLMQAGSRARRQAERQFGGGPSGPGRREVAEQAEIDRILDKIHHQGIDSLTPREKMFLQEMSRKYRDRF